MSCPKCDEHHCKCVKHKCDECKDTGRARDAFGFYPCPCRQTRDGARTG